MLQLGIVLPIILKRISIDDSNKGQEEDLLYCYNYHKSSKDRLTLAKEPNPHPS